MLVPDPQLADQPQRVMASAPAPWSLDLRSWHLTWSDGVRGMHDAPPLFAPTLWQALSFINPDDLPELLGRAAISIRAGKLLETELGIVTTGGVHRRVHLTARPIPDANGRPHLLEGTLAVIGKAAREHDTDARIAQLESALRDWEAFARAIPHELKAPMAIIEGFATVLHARQHSVLSASGLHDLETIRRTAAHAKSLSEALLVLAPMSTQAMRRESVDLSGIAWTVIDLLRAGNDTRTVEITIQSGMHAIGDPDLLRALVGNLLGNAWKFTSKQPVARIEFRQIVTGAQEAFCVSDNGVGFDMAQARKLFTPLVRLHRPGEFEGSGLGLTIAHSVVQRHAGRIWAEASEGAGAKFFFSLG